MTNALMPALRLTALKVRTGSLPVDPGEGGVFTRDTAAQDFKGAGGGRTPTHQAPETTARDGAVRTLSPATS